MFGRTCDDFFFLFCLCFLSPRSLRVFKMESSNCGRCNCRRFFEYANVYVYVRRATAATICSSGWSNAMHTIPATVSTSNEEQTKLRSGETAEKKTRTENGLMFFVLLIIFYFLFSCCRNIVYLN